ncbi:MAG: hypothetical protein EZS28_014855 [Streblomastix strix]|uniref:Uncharacterized protein n=1 Tax=Streblomastix strix TaxID=222440 RepID=A0A5J4W4H2_9EUKA|nr:MAG: hypothetical protein EZS28_014855 [Streblomastix strix]
MCIQPPKIVIEPFSSEHTLCYNVSFLADPSECVVIHYSMFPVQDQSDWKVLQSIDEKIRFCYEDFGHNLLTTIFARCVDKNYETSETTQGTLSLQIVPESPSIVTQDIDYGTIFGIDSDCSSCKTAYQVLKEGDESPIEVQYRGVRVLDPKAKAIMAFDKLLNKDNNDYTKGDIYQEEVQSNPVDPIPTIFPPPGNYCNKVETKIESSSEWSYVRCTDQEGAQPLLSPLDESIHVIEQSKTISCSIFYNGIDLLPHSHTPYRYNIFKSPQLLIYQQDRNSILNIKNNTSKIKLDNTDNSQLYSFSIKSPDINAVVEEEMNDISHITSHDGLLPFYIQSTFRVRSGKAVQFSVRKEQQGHNLEEQILYYALYNSKVLGGREIELDLLRTIERTISPGSMSSSITVRYGSQFLQETADWEDSMIVEKYETLRLNVPQKYKHMDFNEQSSEILLSVGWDLVICTILVNEAQGSCPTWPPKCHRVVVTPYEKEDVGSMSFFESLLDLDYYKHKMMIKKVLLTFAAVLSLLIMGVATFCRLFKWGKEGLITAHKDRKEKKESKLRKMHLIKLKLELNKLKKEQEKNLKDQLSAETQEDNYNKREKEQCSSDAFMKGEDSDEYEYQEENEILEEENEYKND